MLAYSLMKLMSRIACVQPTCFNDALAYALGQIGWLATPKWRRYMAKENVKECLGVSETEAERIAKESVTRFGRMLIEVRAIPSSIKPILGTLSTSKAWNTSKRLMPKAAASSCVRPITEIGKCWGPVWPFWAIPSFPSPANKTMVTRTASSTNTGRWSASMSPTTMERAACFPSDVI